MNRVILTGRLTEDPKTRKAGDNTITDFTLAVDRRKKDEADFFRCTAFGKLAEIVSNHLSKGSKILFDGRVQNNNYTNKDGQKQYSFQFVADHVEFLDGKKKTDTDGFVPVTDEELPFA